MISAAAWHGGRSSPALGLRSRPIDGSLLEVFLQLGLALLGLRFLGGLGRRPLALLGQGALGWIVREPPVRGARVSSVGGRVVVVVIIGRRGRRHLVGVLVLLDGRAAEEPGDGAFVRALASTRGELGLLALAHRARRAELVQRPRQVRRHEHRVVGRRTHCRRLLRRRLIVVRRRRVLLDRNARSRRRRRRRTTTGLPGRLVPATLIEAALQSLVDRGVRVERVVGVRDEVEQRAQRHGLEPLVGAAVLTEKNCHVLAIRSQELERARVVVFDGLRDVDDDDLAAAPQQIVLREVGVDEFCARVHDAHRAADLPVRRAELRPAELGVFEPRRRPAVVADELHDQHVSLHQKRPRRAHGRRLEAPIVPQLLLGPEPDHLARVAPVRIPAPKPVLALDVTLPVAEHEDRRLVHLDREVLLCRRRGETVGRSRQVMPAACEVDVGFFPRREAAVDAVEDAGREELEEDEARARVHDLLRGRAVVAARVPRVARRGLLGAVGIVPRGVRDARRRVEAPRETTPLLGRTA
mmetsp:Transcript_6160/g.25828  ORF Transcript_6160/g.25828 Transcript_6160/m.25828 type:complete len:526 (+) Transcript_6160:1181-2758(+)